MNDGSGGTTTNGNAFLGASLTAAEIPRRLTGNGCNRREDHRDYQAGRLSHFKHSIFSKHKIQLLKRNTFPTLNRNFPAWEFLHRPISNLLSLLSAGDANAEKSIWRKTTPFFGSDRVFCRDPTSDVRMSAPRAFELLAGRGSCRAETLPGSAGASPHHLSRRSLKPRTLHPDFAQEGCNILVTAAEMRSTSFPVRLLSIGISGPVAAIPASATAWCRTRMGLISFRKSSSGKNHLRIARRFRSRHLESHAASSSIVPVRRKRTRW